MATKEVLDYINSQLNAGNSKETITSSLKQGGWNQADIDEAFASLNQSKQPVSAVQPAMSQPVQATQPQTVAQNNQSTQSQSVSMNTASDPAMNQPNSSRPVPKELTDYIQTQKSAGLQSAAIRNALLTSGWQQMDVDEAISQVNSGRINNNVSPSNTAQQANQPKSSGWKMFFIILTIIIILIAGSLIFVGYRIYKAISTGLPFSLTDAVETIKDLSENGNSDNPNDNPITRSIFENVEFTSGVPLTADENGNYIQYPVAFNDVVNSSPEEALRFIKENTYKNDYHAFSMNNTKGLFVVSFNEDNGQFKLALPQNYLTDYYKYSSDKTPKKEMVAPTVYIRTNDIINESGAAFLTQKDESDYDYWFDLQKSLYEDFLKEEEKPYAEDGFTIIKRGTMKIDGQDAHYFEAKKAFYFNRNIPFSKFTYSKTGETQSEINAGLAKMDEQLSISNAPEGYYDFHVMRVYMPLRFQEVRNDAYPKFYFTEFSIHLPQSVWDDSYTKYLLPLMQSYKTLDANYI